MSQLDALSEQFARYLTGWAMSKAILEDYCEAVSKIENVPQAEIKERILKKTEEYFNNAKKAIPKQE